jgi:regulator of replication initiation timing
MRAFHDNQLGLQTTMFEEKTFDLKSVKDEYIRQENVKLIKENSRLREENKKLSERIREYNRISRIKK